MYRARRARALLPRRADRAGCAHLDQPNPCHEKAVQQDDANDPRSLKAIASANPLRGDGSGGIARAGRFIMALKRTSRRRVAGGSEKKSEEADYQLDFVSGIKPFEASSRKVIRESLKRPM